MRSVHDSDIELLELSSLLGRWVRAADGRRLGRVVEVTVVATEGHPRVDLIGVGRHRSVDFVFMVGDFDDLGGRDLLLVEGADIMAAADDWATARLRLNRDVLDCQIIDLAGKRVARVCEVLLARVGDEHHMVGVEVGVAGVLRRLGLHRLANRIPREVVDWADLTLTAQRARTLQLAATAAAVRRLDPDQLAAVLAHIPVQHAVEILRVAHPIDAAGALTAAHPHLGTRLLHALPTTDRDAVLASMDTDRADLLRRANTGVPGGDGEATRSQPGRGRFSGVRRGRSRPVPRGHTGHRGGS